MNKVAKMAGWLLVSLTVSTVAMAQQGGDGGRGGDGGSSSDGGGGGNTSILEVQRADYERARLTRPVEQRRPPNCSTVSCNEQPGPGNRERPLPVVHDSCGGGEVHLLRSRSGRVLQVYCEPW